MVLQALATGCPRIIYTEQQDFLLSFSIKYHCNIVHIFWLLHTFSYDWNFQFSKSDIFWLKLYHIWYNWENSNFGVCVVFKQWKIHWCASIKIHFDRPCARILFGSELRQLQLNIFHWLFVIELTSAWIESSVRSASIALQVHSFGSWFEH